MSRLPVATYPLTGRELVPIVQNGVTKQAQAIDLASFSGIPYPPAGIPVSDGTQWLPSLQYGLNSIAGTVVIRDSNGYISSGIF